MDKQTQRFFEMVQGWYGDPKTNLNTLKQLASAYGEDSPQFSGWCSLQERIGKQLRETKPRHRKAAPKSAWAEIEERARAYAEKQPVTFEHAVTAVLEAEPDLYYQYMVEQTNPG